MGRSVRVWWLQCSPQVLGRPLGLQLGDPHPLCGQDASVQDERWADVQRPLPPARGYGAESHKAPELASQPEQDSVVKLSLLPQCALSIARPAQKLQVDLDIDGRTWSPRLLAAKPSRARPCQRGHQVHRVGDAQQACTPATVPRVCTGMHQTPCSSRLIVIIGCRRA